MLGDYLEFITIDDKMAESRLDDPDAFNEG